MNPKILFIIFFVAIGNMVSYSQTINYKRLNGTWIIYRATQGKNDIIEQYKGTNYLKFESDSNYISESKNVIGDTTFIIKQTSNFRLDQRQNKIFFKNTISEITTIDNKGIKRQEIKKIPDSYLVIVSLDSATNLILLIPEELTDLSFGDTVLYLKKNYNDTKPDNR